MTSAKRIDNKKTNKSVITSAIITFVIVLLLIFSGPLATAVNVAFSVDKTEVTAGATGDDGNITFTIWVNLTDADQYVPLKRVELNLSGPLPKTYSFDMDGGDISGTSHDELTVVRGGDEFNASNYGFGSGIGYSYDEGNQTFGYGYGYGSGSGVSNDPMNVSYTITLNTSNMYDGNYTASAHARAISNTLNFGFIPTTGDVAFTILPRVFTAPISAIPANTTTTPVDVSTPVGNLTYTIVTGSNATIPVTLNVTVQVSPPTINGSQLAAVNGSGSGGLGAGAIPSLYFNYSVNDSSWYDNISYFLINMSYDPSDLPTGVLESTLRPARYLTNTTTGVGWVKLTCPTCTRTLEKVNDSDGVVRDVNLIDSGVNETGNYVWAKVNHFSTFAIAGTTTTTTTTTGGSSGSTGGGGVTTSEPYENIEKAERHEKTLFAGKPVTYTFTASEHGVSEIVITGEANEYDIALRIEVLKSTSKLVSVVAPGAVYKNLNVWAGTKRIKEALIRFKVENSWLGSNNIASGKVKMVRWDGSQWVQLDTTQNTKDNSYTYYEANTGGFSVFAIVGMKEGEVVPTEVEATPTSVTTPTGEMTPAPEATEEKESPGFGVVAFISVMVLMFVIRNRRR